MKRLALATFFLLSLSAISYGQDRECARCDREEARSLSEQSQADRVKDAEIRVMIAEDNARIANNRLAGAVLDAIHAPNRLDRAREKERAADSAAARATANKDWRTEDKAYERAVEASRERAKAELARDMSAREVREAAREAREAKDAVREAREAREAARRDATPLGDNKP